MYPESDYLLLSGLQHIRFCPRQCALIHIEQLWQENFFTASGRAQHEKVHSGVGEILAMKFSFVLRRSALRRCLGIKLTRVLCIILKPEEEFPLKSLRIFGLRLSNWPGHFTILLIRGIRLLQIIPISASPAHLSMSVSLNRREETSLWMYICKDVYSQN